MLASSPNAAVLSPVLTSTPAPAPAPVPENGPGSLKRKADEIVSSASSSMPGPSAQQPPSIATSTTPCGPTATTLVTPRAASSSSAFGVNSVMAIALDSSDDDERDVDVATVTATPSASTATAITTTTTTTPSTTMHTSTTAATGVIPPPAQQQQQQQQIPTAAAVTRAMLGATGSAVSISTAAALTPTGHASPTPATPAGAPPPPVWPCAMPAPPVHQLPPPPTTAPGASPKPTVFLPAAGGSAYVCSTGIGNSNVPIPVTSTNGALAPMSVAAPAAGVPGGGVVVRPVTPGGALCFSLTSISSATAPARHNSNSGGGASNAVAPLVAPVSVGGIYQPAVAAAAAAGGVSAATVASAFSSSSSGGNNSNSRGSHGREGSSSPRSKRRGRGRPLGSRNSKRSEDDEDAPYEEYKPPQRISNFVPNIATRPRRQPPVTRRWADEMANPGEQWQRKVSLPPNPVDANMPEAPTFYPTAQEFRDPLSYIESIRPAAEDFGIAKIVPPPGWNPPQTPLADHINKLLPTKKQALHSLMKSDEVYDDGEDFTVKEYKTMADEFAMRWIKREQPPELLRRNPRKVKAEAPGYALAPVPLMGNGNVVKLEARRLATAAAAAAHAGVATKMEPTPSLTSPQTAAVAATTGAPFNPGGQQQQQQQQQQQLTPSQQNGTGHDSGASAAVAAAAAAATAAVVAAATRSTAGGHSQIKQEKSFSASSTPSFATFPVTQCTPAAARALAAAGASGGDGSAVAGAGVSAGADGGPETVSTLPMASPEVGVFTAERLRELERSYWNVVDGSVEEAEVEYANDLDISEFWSGFPLPPANFMDGSSFDRNKPCDFQDPEYYRTCGWNLNNLPFWPGSVLRFFRTHVNGLTAPWLYLGMQFATFAWHNEDNYLYSLNYHHTGAPKQWYGVPGKHAQGFEACLARILGETLDTVSEHLYRITKMLSPVYLQREKVPVCRLQQEAGQFVVTFPKAYHGGFSYGFNCGEAVNFAVPDWIAYSRESTEAYRQASRKAALSHDKMVATLTMYLPDHDVKGCELVVRELKRIQHEELNGRKSLELEGAQDPSKAGLQLPRFRLGLIDQDTEEYDERRMCKTCKHTLFMTGVACRCNDTDVSCIRCVKAACRCPMTEKYLLSWWTEADLSKFVSTAKAYLLKLRTGQANAAVVASFNNNIDPFSVDP